MRWLGHEALFKRIQALVSSGGGTYLFHGPPSIGKRTVAFEAARAALCVNGSFDECTCPSCTRFDTAHPDFLCIGRAGKVKVDDVDRVVEFMSTSPFLSRRKVVVVDNADAMTWESSNRLLKTMEEPPEGAFFFLVAADPSAVVSTVRGRCIKVEFGSLSADDLANILWKKLGFELPKARVLGWIAANTPSDVFANAGAYLRCRDEAYDLLSTIRGRSIVDCMDFVDKVDRKDVPLFSDMVVLLITDMLLIKNGITGIANVDRMEDVTRMSEPFKDKGLVGAVSVLSQVRKNQYLNVNLGTALKLAVVKAHPMLAA